MKTKKQQVTEYRNEILAEFFKADKAVSDNWREGNIIDILVCRMVEMQYEINQLKSKTEEIENLTSGLKRYGTS